MRTILAILIAVLVISFLLDDRETFDLDRVEFMTKKQLQKFFEDDPDGYERNHNEINLKARGYKNVDELKKDIIAVADDFSEEEKTILRKMCGEVDQFFMNFAGVDSFDSKKAANVKWKFAKTKGAVYENGYPHTRQDIIFLPEYIIKSKELKRTLVHEKVHVYSRLYPNEMKEWTNKNGYIEYRKFSEYPLARNNSDINDVVYLDKNKKETLCQYRSENPNSLEDATYPGGFDFRTEHPYEVLAYEIDSYIK